MDRSSARRLAGIRTALVAALVVALDQITKHTLGTWIRPGQVRHLIPGLTLVYERNTGVAFSFLAGTGSLVYVVTGAVLAALVAFVLLRPGRMLWLPIGMLVGGAIGNLIDRIARGSVVDFVKLPHWPAFNFADMSVTFAVVVLAFVLDRDSHRA